MRPPLRQRLRRAAVILAVCLVVPMVIYFRYQDDWNFFVLWLAMLLSALLTRGLMELLWPERDAA